MKKKRFDKTLYEQNDKIAKDAILKYLGSGWKENPKKRDPDIISDDGLKFVEVEIKRVWKGAAFPYGDIQLPYRKGKWKDLDIVFYVLNNEQTHAIKIPRTSLKDKYLREVPNKYVYEGEYFYGIPMDECEIIELQEI